jgi:lipopolysaccharide/colanic/teichoic acid biosynthesis glycosyltransferase
MLMTTETTNPTVGPLDAKVNRPMPVDDFLRRATDIVLSVILLILLSPLFAVIMLLVWLRDAGPPIFAHERIGQGGVHFKCYKFRSMLVDADARLAHLLATSEEARAEWLRDHKLKVDPRITPLGRFLRKTSLDEFPQLVNVLRGEMSLVGPRPIVAAEICKYGRRFHDYSQVKPGLTGLWQISGRNNTTYRRRVALDVMYSRSVSYPIYLKILIGTIPAVLLSRGSY